MAASSSNPSVTAELDIRQFNRLTERMVRVQPGRSVESVLKHRMAEVLALAVKKAKPRKVKTGKSGRGAGITEAVSGKESTRKLAYGQASTFYQTMSRAAKARVPYVRIGGRWVNAASVTRRGGKGRKVVKSGIATGSGLAGEIVSLRKAQQKKYADELKTSKAARGLGQRQFVEMGRDLGLAVPAKAFVTGANYRGKTYANLTSGRKVKDADSLHLVVKTTSTAAVRHRDAFLAAIRGKNAQLARALNKAQGKDIRKVLAGASGVDITTI